MDDSKVASGPHAEAVSASVRAGRHRPTFNGEEAELPAPEGVRAMRVSHRGGRTIAEHRHDWPTLTIFVAGACTERLDGEAVRMSGPAAILLPAGHSHADDVGEEGLETFGLVLDPAWLRKHVSGLTLDAPLHWTRGRAAGAANSLQKFWRRPGTSEADLARATCDFLELCAAQDTAPEPGWLADVLDEVHLARDASTQSIARRLDLSPAWLARAYLATCGEGLQDTLRRRRVERASAALRTTRQSLAEIALAAGFCDQSHMNRGFRSVLGRTPLQVRRSAFSG